MKVYRAIFLICAWVVVGILSAEAQIADTILIDSIVVQGNWRTRDQVVLSELGFEMGDRVSAGRLDTAMMRLWNIGNFSRVSYGLDTIASGSYQLMIRARDAFTVVPILSYSGSRGDWQGLVGVSDDNFLGRNIGVDLGAEFGTNEKSYWVGFSIPRQLLYGNMSISGGISAGQNTNRRLVDGLPVAGVVYDQREAGISISNPWHEDFEYRFTPDMSLSYFEHRTDSVFDVGHEIAPAYHKKFVAIGLSESAGYIRRMRHQRDGYRLTSRVGLGVDLTGTSHYFSLSGEVEYYKLISRWLQLSMRWRTGYISSQLPSLIYYHGSGTVRGIRTGEISGQGYYAAAASLDFTYFNLDWLAMEHSLYINAGAGADKYLDLYRDAPITSVGTGLYFYIPSIPWMGFRMYFTYLPHGSNWFQFVL